MPVRIYLAICALVGWATIFVQYYLMLEVTTVSPTETITRFFSFFTILSNILVALAETVLAFHSRGRAGQWFSRPSVQTAVSIYIFVVALVYNAVLRPLWSPQGAQKSVDELLHLVLPLTWLIYWLYSTRRSELEWRQIPSWLIYPAVYAVYVMVRGSIVGWYPYPFLNVHVLGFPRVVLNIAVLVLVFGLTAAIPVAIGALARRRPRRKTS